MNRTFRGFFVVLSALLVALVGFATVASASAVLGQMDPGDTLYPGEALYSPDGRYQLIMQEDGNLVEYKPGHVAVAETHSTGQPEVVLFMQRDGNLVLRARGNVPIWSTYTDGHPGTVLQLQDDGALILYGPGHQVLRVLLPALEKSYVDSPRPGPSTNAPGVSDSDVSDYVYDGTRLMGCAAAGKAIPGQVGLGVEVACGMLTDDSPAKVDGYGVFRTFVCAAAGPFGPACDILTEDKPAG
jgi:hypothetical protein